MLRIAHIVNPLIVTNPASDLNYAQPVTLKSMQLARERAMQTSGIEVTQYAAFYEEDRRAVPVDFITTPVLERSVLDYVKPTARVGGRKLPLLCDILDRLYESAKYADYLIYSNIDIGLWPDFYLEVKRLIEEGTESFLIRRRNLSTEFTSPDELDKILKQNGTPHNGYSCFVFPRAHYTGYVLDDTCIGLQPVSVTLTINMIQRAVSFQNFSNVRLTFHIGDDSEWKQSLLDDCHLHNERALDRVVHQLAADGLLPYTAKVLELYQRKRSTYVIDNCSNRFSRTLYRAMRKFGFGDWVAARYDNNRN